MSWQRQQCGDEGSIAKFVEFPKVLVDEGLGAGSGGWSGPVSPLFRRCSVV